jgi:histone H2B
MAPKPASTAGKAPASTASKAPAKTTTETKPKAAKKTAAKAEGGEEKKKRRKVRKETYSSYIYKGENSFALAYVETFIDVFSFV